MFIHLFGRIGSAPEGAAQWTQALLQDSVGSAIDLKGFTEQSPVIVYRHTKRYWAVVVIEDT